ncbi:hypothetical protein [Actinotalea sp. K2]|uniref:hypothetical protein n=1 Tax=Actinotalea sp. K2 TaxID=2939438 RepID=UPI00201780EB|nr:hypothetical protein [Actinotalea sp. K2]MCL3860953.1 hypothetical protein [Actinotalea sp. K2]
MTPPRHSEVPSPAGSTPQGPDPAHQVPAGVDDATVVAVGKLTAALEVVEQARGMLYGFHRMTGRADNDLVEALDALEEAGHGDLAGAMRTELFGRNVIAKRWTFQIVEDYDDSYWQPFRDWERTVREQLMDGRRHVYEARLKEQNRTHGKPGHEARPAPQE